MCEWKLKCKNILNNIHLIKKTQLIILTKSSNLCFLGTTTVCRQEKQTRHQIQEQFASSALWAAQPFPSAVHFLTETSTLRRYPVTLGSEGAQWPYEARSQAALCS